MGLSFSTEKPVEVPPKIVLVPPRFERDLKGRSRFSKSSYDYLFAKKPLKWLFGDYHDEGLKTIFLLSPKADPRVSIKAKLAYKDSPTGVMSVRFQPEANELHTFVDLKASPNTPEATAVRVCCFSPETGVGAFSSFPLTKGTQPAEVGMRFSSLTFTAGTIIQPHTLTLKELWLAGRLAGFSAGLQLRPDLDLATLLEKLPRQTAADTAAQKGGEGAAAAAGRPPPAMTSEQLMDWAQERTSCAVAYSPSFSLPSGQGSFTAAVEMIQGRALEVSFFQHLATTRRVLNPFEDEDVVGITNYLDLGIVMRSSLVPGPAGVQKEAGSVRVAASWQVNKNWLVKGRLGSDSVAVALGFKSWFQPSLAVAACADYNWHTHKPRLGLTLQLENFGALKYERSRDEELRGSALTQRHEATDADMQNFAGRQERLVLKSSTEQDYNLPAAATSQYL